MNWAVVVGTLALASPGVRYERIRSENPVAIAHVVRVDLADPETRVEARRVGETSMFPFAGAADFVLSEAAKRLRLIAAINGDFMIQRGDPLGVLMENGELISRPKRNLPALLLGQGTAQIDVIRWNATIDAGPWGKSNIHGLNEECGANLLVLVTSTGGEIRVRPGSTVVRIKPPTSTLRVPVDFQASVEKRQTVGRSIVARKDEWLLIGRQISAAFLRRIPDGTNVRIRVRLVTRTPIAVDQAVGGGPRLVRSGRISHESEAVGFNWGLRSSRLPRSAVGLTARGELLLVAVESGPRAPGLTLPGLAALMKRLGCREAINLDGGSASQLWASGRLVNLRSLRHSRPVSTMIAVLSEGQP